ncbi:hypothetical protein FNW02_33565 [Komarekiella sp. 'clone 1']|uniref:Uncharacterized protein n=1 Tax=Komarekiella delphini-convector SJRDD-AB1 TaxID=2593771 RepID=A0AA40T435_9NOST|nr:hypothetical protein [Komarekiella delphini-convector]MBD6620569.1 hypothetical protein [Komarekiella delphini-convector SJRDD-AB1]
MQFSEIPQFYISAETSANQSTLMATHPIAATHNEAKTKDGDIPATIVFLAPICFITVGAIYLFIISSFLKFTEKKNRVSNVVELKQYPCRNCKFFDDNNYLKCAVNPSDVLTKQAINCSEYQMR